MLDCSVTSFGVGYGLRSIHLLAPEHQLAQLETDFAVVDDEGDLACPHRIVSTSDASPFANPHGPVFPLCSIAFSTLDSPRASSGEGCGEGRGGHLRSTNATNLPVRPPTRPRALDRPFAAPVMAGPAAEVTRDRPSAALVLYSSAVFLAASADDFADSAVFCAVDDDDDSKRRAAVLRSRGASSCRRRRGRARAVDMFDVGFVVGMTKDPMDGSERLFCGYGRDVPVSLGSAEGPAR